MVAPALCDPSRGNSLKALASAGVFFAQRWPGKTGHWAKWIFCLTAAIVPHDRRANEQTTTPEPQPGIQAEAIARVSLLGKCGLEMADEALDRFAREVPAEAMTMAKQFQRLMVDIDAPPYNGAPAIGRQRLRDCAIRWQGCHRRLRASRRIAATEQTYYRWRKEYGGLKTDQARRMKDLEKENLRLRRAISDLTLDKLILQEAGCA